MRLIATIVCIAVGAFACQRSEPVTGTRLVSLTPSASEIVAALGATDKLVGVDDYSTFPAEVAKLPKVGSFLAPNLETIVRLKPSLVIVDDVHGQVAGALGDAGIATIECAIHELADVKTCLTRVGAKIGMSTAATTAIATIDATVRAAETTRPAARPRVLVVIDREADGLGNLIAAGPASWVDELLHLVGADNMLAAAGVRYPKISIEEVLRGKPDVILDLSFAGKAGIAPWQGVPVPAVANHRVTAMSEPYLTAPSPRVGAALDAISRAIASPPQ